MVDLNTVIEDVCKAVQNPDTFEASMQSVIDTLKQASDEYAETEKELEKANTRIRDLQDTNHKLFLAQVGTPDEPEPDETELPTGPDVIKEFLSRVNKKEEV